jgi:hypothetical protein
MKVHLTRKCLHPFKIQKKAASGQLSPAAQEVFRLPYLMRDLLLLLKVYGSSIQRLCGLAFLVQREACL